jgi:alpha-tubulin suppressor-like RCC1 family protein
LAIREDGSIFAWGNNDFGQLNVPEPNSGFVAVTCGADFSLGLKEDGSIVAWGNFDPICSEPEPNSGYLTVTANNWYAYALKSISPGDINQDGVVNVVDLLATISSWGQCPVPPASCPADLNHDGTVNVTDLLIVINNWS